MRSIRANNINPDSEPVLTNFSRGKTMTCLQLEQQIALTHSTLKACGVEKRRPVVIVDDESQEFVAQVMGILVYGAVAVITPADINRDELEMLLKIHDNAVDINTLKREDGCIQSERRGTEIVDFADEDTIIIEYKRNKDGQLTATTIQMQQVATFAESIRKQYVRIRHLRTAMMLIASRECYNIMTVVALLHIGAQVVFAGGNPSASALIKCIKRYRPHFVTISSATAEKIIRERVFPLLLRPETMAYMNSSHARRTMYRQVRKRMMFALGGCIINVYGNGRRLSNDVDQFLQRIDFPYTTD